MASGKKDRLDINKQGDSVVGTRDKLPAALDDAESVLEELDVVNGCRDGRMTRIGGFVLGFIAVADEAEMGYI